MAERKEGFKDPSVVNLTEDIEEATTNIDIIRSFLKTFQRSNEEIEKLKKTKFYQIF